MGKKRSGGTAPCAISLPRQGSEQFGVRDAEWGPGAKRQRTGEMLKS